MPQSFHYLDLLQFTYVKQAPPSLNREPNKYVNEMVAQQKNQYYIIAEELTQNYFTIF